MKKILYMLLILIFTFILIYNFICGSVDIPLKLVAIEKSDVHVFSYWKTICTEDDLLLDKLKECGVHIPEVDFQKNNLIVSQGKEILSISYKRISCLQDLFNKKIFLGAAQYGDLNEEVIYFYTTKKINIIYDVFNDPI